MNVLNRRFNTLNCLDLDYHSFKTCFFQSKTQKKELYQECMQRNAITWKYIHSYSKFFSDYLKKKEKYVSTFLPNQTARTGSRRSSRASSGTSPKLSRRMTSRTPAKMREGS